MERTSGILLHISSLPTSYGIGDFGPAGYGFVDFLKEAGQGYWQILPLSPTREKSGNSPYSSPSAFAINPLFISPQELVHRGYLNWEDIPVFRGSHHGPVDFNAVTRYKESLFRAFFHRYTYKNHHAEFAAFRKENAHWLEDFCLYTVLTKHLHEEWTQWPDALRKRNKKRLEEISAKYQDEILREEWLQFLACEQWTGLKHYANERGIRIFGDLPLYVHGNSVDCWAHPEYFSFDEDLQPIIVSGVPPDYYSEDGQLWGSPVYNWGNMEKNGFSWWISRIEQNLKLFDLVRIDHFRGLSAYWGIPHGEKTAKNGVWYKAPGEALFSKLKECFPEMPFVAEDLGDIDQEVLDLRDQFDLPGMNVLHFAFGDRFHPNQYLPHRYSTNSITYTGTHDNNTTRGWFRRINQDTKEHLKEYLGWKPTRNSISDQLIRMAYRCVSNLTIIPMQDLLDLDEDAMMNQPGTAFGNWAWKVEKDALSRIFAEKLREQMLIFSRSNKE